MFAAVNSNNVKVNNLFLLLIPQFNYKFMITYRIMVLIKTMKINSLVRLKYLYKVTVGHTSKKHKAVYMMPHR